MECNGDYMSLFGSSSLHHAFGWLNYIEHGNRQELYRIRQKCPYIYMYLLVIKLSTFYQVYLLML